MALSESTPLALPRQSNDSTLFPSQRLLGTAGTPGAALLHLNVSDGLVQLSEGS
jgi:hypothetical protein